MSRIFTNRPSRIPRMYPSTSFTSSPSFHIPINGFSSRAVLRCFMPVNVNSYGWVSNSSFCKSFERGGFPSNGTVQDHRGLGYKRRAFFVAAIRDRGVEGMRFFQTLETVVLGRANSSAVARRLWRDKPSEPPFKRWDDLGRILKKGGFGFIKRA